MGVAGPAGPLAARAGRGRAPSEKPTARRKTPTPTGNPAVPRGTRWVPPRGHGEVVWRQAVARTVRGRGTGSPASTVALRPVGTRRRACAPRGCGMWSGPGDVVAARRPRPDARRQRTKWRGSGRSAGGGRLPRKPSPPITKTPERSTGNGGKNHRPSFRLLSINSSHQEPDSSIVGPGAGTGCVPMMNSSRPLRLTCPSQGTSRSDPCTSAGGTNVLRDSRSRLMIGSCARREAGGDAASMLRRQGRLLYPLAGAIPSASDHRRSPSAGCCWA